MDTPHGQYTYVGPIRYAIIGCAPAGANTKRANPKIVGLLGLKRKDGSLWAAWLYTDGTHGKLSRA